MSDLHPPMIFSDDFVEHHDIGWRVEPGTKDPNNPLIAPKYPWDEGSIGQHGTVLKDPTDGLYKAWYVSMPRHTYDRQLTYATSEDGVNWERPELDIYPCDGYERTNIILGSAMGGWVSQPAVFIVPDAEPEKRYEMFCFRDPFEYQWERAGYGCPNHLIEGLPVPDGLSHHYYGLYRHFSSDGIHWKPEGDPICGSKVTKAVYGDKVFITSDGVCLFRLRGGRYVMHNKVEIPAIPGGYVRYDIGRGICRTIVRRESDDGWQWQEPYESIMTPDWRDSQDTQFLELMMTEYNQAYIGIATILHAGEQTVDLQFASSADGKTWMRPGRRPCVSLEPLGDVGGGMLWPTPEFIIDGDQVHLYYGGHRGLHGDIYADLPHNGTRAGALCRASWSLGRMWAVINFGGHEAPAWFTTPPTDLGGKMLYLNALTRGNGKVMAELLDEQRKPIPGYSREECKPFTGDQKCAAITWATQSKAPTRKAMLRIILEDAFVYGFDWR